MRWKLGGVGRDRVNTTTATCTKPPPGFVKALQEMMLHAPPNQALLFFKPR